MLGDMEHPISILFEPELRGAHVHVAVRAGHRPDRGHAGDLVMRPEEWQVLSSLLGCIGDIATLVTPIPRPLTEDCTIWCDVNPLELGMPT